mmetsp:Transcript_14411/g.36473  ORF Transcript_14411/g.36473 Transcript_14411/m.36473 type:complete len:222 (+) Transcript_14411:781-1446(+)
MAARHALPSCQTMQWISGPGSTQPSCSSLSSFSRVSTSAFSFFSASDSSPGFGCALLKAARAAVAVATAARCSVAALLARSPLRRDTRPSGSSSYRRRAPTCQSPLGLVHLGLSVSAAPCSPSSANPSARRTVDVSTSPLPVQSTRSTILGAPVLVVCNPAAPGSTPVSKMATTTPRPSNSGCAARKRVLPVSSLGIAPRHSAPSSPAIGGRIGAAAMLPS